MDLSTVFYFRSGVSVTGIIKDFMNFRKFKYSPILFTRGEYAATGDLYDSDIIGAIANCIASNVAKLQPQIVRKNEAGMVIKDDYLARLLGMRWAPELTPYDALYKIASDVVYKSNSFSVIFYNEDFTRVERIVPITTKGYRIFEDDNGNILFRFTWDYDGKTYCVPYSQVIHIKARFNKKRFLGTPPDGQLQSTLDLIEKTGEGLKNLVNSSANLKGYLKYTNFIDEEELKAKVKEFRDAYMDATNEGGLAGIDNSVEFHEISQKAPTIPTLQIQFLRENVYRYYNVNDKILTSQFNESEWNAFFESVIEPIAIQLSLEFTFKVISERERGFGNKIIFTANRLQYATLQTRTAIGKELFDRGVITINEYRELMYYEPLEDGDVRMISLNYVKTDDQSTYQVGEDGSSGDQNEETQQQKALIKQYMRIAIPAVSKIKKGVND